MRKDSLFQLVVVADIAFALLTIATEFVFHETLPPPLRARVLETLYGGGIAAGFLFFLWIAVVVSAIVSWIGLLSFWWPARGLFIGSWLLMLALVLLSGPSVMTAPGAVLDTLSHITSGILIGMMFFCDEVKQRFEEDGLVAAAT